MPIALVLALLSGACGGGRKMHERPVQSSPRGTTSASQPAARPATAASPMASSAATYAPAVEPRDARPVTPRAYAAAAPQKPKITGLSEEELQKCERELPPLETCKPARTLAEGGASVANELRACVARYVAALDGCLCTAGSKAHCQYEEDQKREAAKMVP
jgi:hypothetical protein